MRKENMTNLIEIKDLHVSVEGKEILKGLNLTLEAGKVNALMGPNGSGKSTLANTLMGHPKYEVTSGKIIFKGKDITKMPADERAREGLFLSFQYPSEVSGITISNLLRSALNARRGEKDKIPLIEFKKVIDEKMALLKMDKKFMMRYLNEGFSGGEKKKAEILQLLVLNPTLAILDETDSGLDIDALRIVSEGVNAFMNKTDEIKDRKNEKKSEKKKIERVLKKDKCCLIITHYKRILEYVKPDHVFIMVNGKIVLEGKGDLVNHLEEKGYGWVQED